MAGLFSVICWLTVSLQAQEISLSSLPPVIVKTIPQSGDTDVDPDLGEIKITFSMDMLDQSWSFVQVSEESYPQIQGKPEYLDDRRTCVVKVNLEPGKTYAIWLNSDRHKNFKGTNQKSAIPYILSFSTAVKSK